jgi:glycosyltransferase involved in cell wall biosynthesis
VEVCVSILFDLSATQPDLGKFHGGSEYAKSILNQLLIMRQNGEMALFFDPDRWLDPTAGRKVREAGMQLFEVRNNRELQTLVDSGAYGRVYSALPYRYGGMDFSKVEFVFSILGLRAIEMPTDKYEWVYSRGFSRLLKYIYKNVNRGRYVEGIKSRFSELLGVPAKRKTIIAISNHTKYSLLSNFPGLQPDEIFVMYAPRTRREIVIPQEGKVSATVLSKFRVTPEKYFLLINSDRWIKNAFRAVKALDEVFSDHPGVDKTVLVLGSDNPPFGKLIKNKVRFDFFGYASDIELESLYQSAYAFIYPTLNEGFGYPPLESMKYGTPAICSAVASTTEVCGDAVLYFNPFSVGEIKNRILYIVFEPGARERYSALGKERSHLVAAKQDNMLNELCRLILAP